ncbi:hypothetical protein [Halomarina pelagica]|uniref:hypothetical protein n=1 Tax=Halomarina pelagica TaxID=2961599 RepID=UPI0020C4FD78|nr:hypothetical protein [Halomarina sp. BND7]
MDEEGSRAKDRFVPDVEAHVIDTNLFIKFERADAVSLLERPVTAADAVLLVPPRVYAELTPAEAPYDRPPIDAAIAACWARVIENVEYADPVVSTTMDMIRRYIAVADDRPEHDIEQADGEVGGVAAQHLAKGDTVSVAVYTNDRAAFRGIDRALATHGYEDRLELVNASEFFEAVQDRYDVETSR